MMGPPAPSPTPPSSAPTSGPKNAVPDAQGLLDRDLVEGVDHPLDVVGHDRDSAPRSVAATRYGLSRRQGRDRPSPACPAVLVHGVPDTQRLWDKLRSRLSRRDVLAPSLPGLPSPRPPASSR